MSIQITCAYCQGTFSSPHWKHQRFCSRKCSANGRIVSENRRSITKHCLECEVEFSTYPSVNKKFCSSKCCAVYYGKLRVAKHKSPNHRNRERRTEDGRRVHLNRYFMEQKLGRPLKPKEIVHHIDLDEQNNPEDCSNYHLYKSPQTHGFGHHSLNKIVKELLAIGIIRFDKGKYIISQPYLK